MHAKTADLQVSLTLFYLFSEKFLSVEEETPFEGGMNIQYNQVWTRFFGIEPARFFGIKFASSGLSPPASSDTFI